MSAPSGASEQKNGTSEITQDSDDLPDMLDAKLWQNPCPFSFRINYLSLLYNTPLYAWIQDTYGLKRHEYVVIYSLALADGGSARDISRTSGFPKNTLSRAVKRLEMMGLLEERSKAPGGGRRQALRLSDKGRKLFNETVSVFESYEEKMLTPLSKGERQILFELMSKVVVGAEDWADDLPQTGATDSTKNAKGEMR
ncbi:MarR family winged helix-turn-helix transcriptional regulator [Neptunicoccus cionae]|uniref:HTH marR-type domain-containing protein n=1 Tax=Neptunicoccus cionae TaxID=2035344 RepID=A0A916QUC1_9RHOB|nr:MarR family winged helix-turn-helix transcriptional regulator [Amylibacter cionae]GGA13663.1 hypothetical protein GCM10011498_12140 [Amylibacter cionae]